MTNVMFTGGGTGGHIFPGLAVAAELRKDSSITVEWIGSSSGMDRELVSGAGIRFYGIPSGKLRRYFSFRNFIDLFKIVLGCFGAFCILARRRPVFLFSKGGFVSVPPCLAARLLGIPVYTHECDFSPGLATRINSKSAKGIFVSYEETVNFFPAHIRSRVTVTGNPVRSEFYSASREKGRAFLGCAHETLPVLLVLGGSLGARQVNALVRASVNDLCTKYIVVHQTGRQNDDQVSYPLDPALRNRYKPYQFIRSEMADVLAAADVVVSRSGANSVWECAVTGKPMVLVPLEASSSRGDQVENAKYFVSRGAAVMLTGADVTSAHLVSMVSKIADDSRIRSDMGANAAALGSVRPHETIASLLRVALNEERHT
jgi:UDP-N-acetylglucosamine--N-acetylmuramyl-(pentapeptide) pyrophosphoryl-undecaprenol N-acetylglucosamine transferase